MSQYSYIFTFEFPNGKSSATYITKKDTTMLEILDSFKCFLISIGHPAEEVHKINYNGVWSYTLNKFSEDKM